MIVIDDTILGQVSQPSCIVYMNTTIIAGTNFTLLKFIALM